MTDEDIHYALRLTPYPNTEGKVTWCRERLGGFIEAVGGQNYVFGQEYERNHHFHVVFELTKNFTKEDKIQFRDFLYDTFEVPKDKKGNPTFSLEPVRKFAEALSYAVKDGDYECSEQWKDIIATAYENSHQKTHSMKSSLANLSAKYIDGEISDRELWIGLGQSRADLGIPLSIRWIDEMMFSIQCKKNPELLLEKWQDKIIKEQNKNL